jgi:prevent-host-death family protein
MEMLNLHHAKAQLSRLVEQALAGEEVIIAKAGKPMVRLVPCEGTEAPRPLGLMKGKIWLADDFDSDVMSEEELKNWYEGEL